ncbi:hypothetical protein [Acinetobacter parvus]|uniref:Uncharacterized protein n=1 Tax=Acinetobacter parvus NIPH 1103 TaxID=1217671 RepID=N8RFY7_9GAMM|nr:hypothetical protein [Acinetobacter parvus]ENU32454.1 hypothetical protein F989_02434 [Acinetobacter parvus NIPH 1103]
MANLSYWLTQSPTRHDYNYLISVDLDGLFNEQWYPYHVTITSEISPYTLTQHFPVSTTGREINCIRTQSYFDDYYNRIHISPGELALGNIASEQSQTVNVWNAYLIPKILHDIENIPEGIGVSGQPTPPLNFTALQERPWNISISSDGPSSLDALITWKFGTDQAKLRITGTRIVAFGWLVDWSKSVGETLQWLTDILQSSTGHEQRRSLRLSPKITLEADFLLTDAERQYFDLVMVGWSARTFAVPVWNQQQWLKTAHVAGGLVVYCDTTYRNFRPNRLAVLRGQTAFDNETIEIESILSDRLILKRPLIKSWPKGTCLSPAVTAQLESSPQLIKRTDRMMRTHAVLNVTEAVDHANWLPSQTYRGNAVMTEAPNEKDDLTHTHERLLNVLENKTGFALKTDTAKAAFQLYQYAWMTVGRQQQANLRGLFYALRGSQKAIWLPTFSDDLTVKNIIPANTQTMDVQWCGYTRFALNQLSRQDIQIILKNGSVLYRRITSATEIDSTTERLGLDQIITSQVNPKDIFRISFLSLCRLSNDTVSFEHINDSDGIAKCSVTWRGVREL